MTARDRLLRGPVFVSGVRVILGGPKNNTSPDYQESNQYGQQVCSIPLPSSSLPSHPLPPSPNPSPYPSLWHDFNHDTIYSALFSLWARPANRIMFVCACPGTQIYICRLKPYRTISLEWRDEHALMPHIRHNAPLTHFIIARY